MGLWNDCFLEIDLLGQIILDAVYSNVPAVCSIASSGFLGLLQDIEALQDWFCHGCRSCLLKMLLEPWHSVDQQRCWQSRF